MDHLDILFCEVPIQIKYFLIDSEIYILKR